MIELENIVTYCIDNLGLTLIQKGNGFNNKSISGPRNGDDANSENITFYNYKSKEKVFESIKNSRAGLIILDSEIPLEKCVLPKNIFVFVSENAKQIILEISKLFFSRTFVSIIHFSAVISTKSTIGKNPFISSGVVVDDNVSIGENVFIEPNVYIQQNVIIGNNVIIKANSVIGGNGFGYVKQSDDTFEYLPHFGKVIIEDNVHIGSNSCIDRGSLSDTILRKGCKIDNLVHIAHNVEIGENTLVIANALIAGSVKIGKNCWIAPSSTIKNGIEIGDNVTVGMSTLVLKSINDNETVVGVPGKLLK